MADYELNLFPHQQEFFNDDVTPYLAMIGGFGCGKTRALCYKLLKLAMLNAGIDGAALSPNYGEAHRVLVPTFIEVLEELGIKYKFNKSAFRMDIEIKPHLITKIHVLSAENYIRARGLNLAFFGFDEMDGIQRQIAQDAWRMLVSRLRRGNVIQGVAVSTPEGYSFMYDFWKKNADKHLDRRLIQGKTRDNIYLPDSYIQGLLKNYPAHLLAAYMEGEFVNMEIGSVYVNYNRRDNRSNLTLKDINEFGAQYPLHIGMDFNVKSERSRGISIVTTAIVGDVKHVVSELYDSNTTQEAIRQIRFEYGNRPIYLYPDASADHSETSASDSDLQQLRDAGLKLCNPAANPKIKNRVNAVNAQLHNGQGRRNLLINDEVCPVIADSLEHQPWDENTRKPLKDGMMDGPVDALGYFINVRWPAVRCGFNHSPINF